MNASGKQRDARVDCCAVFLAAALLFGAGCGVQVEGQYPLGDYDASPTDAFLATTEPVYFDGHAAYWYSGRWFYREGTRWQHYQQEPPSLYQRRMQSPPLRRTYEPAPGRPAGRAAPRSRGR